MQVLQEKLIWFLGCSSLMVVFYKANLAHLTQKSQISIKLRLGLLLITCGTVIGVISRLGALGRWFLESGVSFYLESIIGYLVGWSLLVWAIIEWAGDRHGRQHDSLAKSRLRLFSERAAEIIPKEHTASSLMEGISKHLLGATDCQAITLHRRDDNNMLNLAFQSGLDSDTEQAIRQPQSESLFYAACKKAQVMASDTSLDLHTIVRLETRGNQLVSGLSLPVVSNGETLGVLTVFCTRQREFGEDELAPLEMVGSALAGAMKHEMTEHTLLHESGFRDLIKMISHSFEGDGSLLSALVESARILHGRLSLREFNLYVSGNGPVKTHDFAFSEGGLVNFYEGYFSKTDYPFLNLKRAAVAAERKSYVVPFEYGGKSQAWLELRSDDLKGLPDYFPELISSWTALIARRLGNEELERTRKQASQWLGAIRYCQERALTTNDLSSFLKEITNIVVDLELATFCRISLVDPEKTHLKTSALAQIRSLSWLAEREEIATSELELHRRALVERKCIEFDQDSLSRKMPEIESSAVLPAGVRHGLIVPLVIGDEAVGLLTLGESREQRRSADPAELFASSLAALISLMLSWHKEKRVSQEIKEGKKKLTIIQREPQKAPSELTPRLRSRINGPLAGIMASCEYLQQTRPDLDSEVNRYLNLIERNAGRLHEMTAEIKTEV